MGDAPPRVTVVVPTYNERPNLEELAGRVLALGPSRLEALDWEKVPFVHNAADDE